MKEIVAWLWIACLPALVVWEVIKFLRWRRMSGSEEVSRKSQELSLDRIERKLDEALNDRP